MTRSDELAAGLASTRAKLAAACEAAGRDPGEVSLLPVTKFFPASDVALLQALGCTEFGENREQEAAAKAAELADARFHMLGHIQRNKAKSVARWAAMVHSVDSPRLADALERGAAAALDGGLRDGPLPVLVQISLDGDPARGGVPRADLDELCETVAEAPSLALRGVMGVPPLEADPEAAFAELAEIRAGVLERHPGAGVFSAGMSGDLEVAVKFGSTCVRVGTGILGRRPLTSLP
ncbi:YggS family pyridoxal phosphate-dependent enzyme [Tsukamurella sp. 1534]|uniref:YggS family pyridoxal phosphate-dependent enzyme n=1 Tax=Tsukamurella sp. 1534 TaxID=1151061 RepID=UPI0002EA09E4|nr:YggS family pyridoxal phosphate-dependent enzyme [Tsukamurella sp. 1534]